MEIHSPVVPEETTLARFVYPIKDYNIMVNYDIKVSDIDPNSIVHGLEIDGLSEIGKISHIRDLYGTDSYNGLEIVRFKMYGLREFTSDGNVIKELLEMGLRPANLAELICFWQLCLRDASTGKERRQVLACCSEILTKWDRFYWPMLCCNYVVRNLTLKSEYVLCFYESHKWFTEEKSYYRILAVEDERLIPWYVAEVLSKNTLAQE